MVSIKTSHDSREIVNFVENQFEAALI